MSRRSKQSGLTLIEVVVSIALLGSLLAGTLFAYGRHKRQLVTANDRMLAAQGADQLLNRWLTVDAGIPFGQQGPMDEMDGFQWQTSRVDGVVGGPDKAGIVELRVFRVDNANRSESMPDFLFQVQLLVARDTNSRAVVPAARAGDGNQ